MKFSKNDLSHSRNMLKALGKGEWKLDGMEVLAFADMMRWFASVQKAIEMEVSTDEAAEKAKIEQQKKLAEGVLEPKPVEDAVKPIDASPTAISVDKKGSKGKK